MWKSSTGTNTFASHLKKKEKKRKRFLTKTVGGKKPKGFIGSNQKVLNSWLHRF